MSSARLDASIDSSRRVMPGVRRLSLVMRREISISATMPKLFTPIIFGGVSLLLLIGLVQEWKDVAFSQMWFPLLWVTAVCAGCCYVLQLKSVSVDDKNLYIRNLLKEVSVPLSEVEHVRYYAIAANIRPVIIDLRKPCRFGRKIIFEPPPDSLFIPKEPAVVNELRELVKQSKKAESLRTDAA